MNTRRAFSEMDRSQYISYSEIHEYLKTVKKYYRCIDKILIKSVKYRGEPQPSFTYQIKIKDNIKDKTKNILSKYKQREEEFKREYQKTLLDGIDNIPIEYKYAGRRYNKVLFIEKINRMYSYDFVHSGDWIIYLVNAILKYFKHITIWVQFDGVTYFINEPTRINFCDSYNFYPQFFKYIARIRSREAERREKRIAEGIEYKWKNKLSEQLNNTNTINEILNILKREIGYFNNKEESSLYTEFLEMRNRVIRLEKLIDSRKNSYVVSKLKSGDLHADDIKKYPELIEATDELIRLKMMVK